MRELSRENGSSEPVGLESRSGATLSRKSVWWSRSGATLSGSVWPVWCHPVVIENAKQQLFLSCE
jgi:hypothetical protein